MLSSVVCQKGSKSYVTSSLAPLYGNTRISRPVGTYNNPFRIIVPNRNLEEQIFKPPPIQVTKNDYVYKRLKSVFQTPNYPYLELNPKESRGQPPLQPKPTNVILYDHLRPSKTFEDIRYVINNGSLSNEKNHNFIQYILQNHIELANQERVPLKGDGAKISPSGKKEKNLRYLPEKSNTLTDHLRKEISSASKTDKAFNKNEINFNNVSRVEQHKNNKLDESLTNLIENTEEGPKILQPVMQPKKIINYGDIYAYLRSLGDGIVENNPPLPTPKKKNNVILKEQAKIVQKPSILPNQHQELPQTYQNNFEHLILGNGVLQNLNAVLGQGLSIEEKMPENVNVPNMAPDVMEQMMKQRPIVRDTYEQNHHSFTAFASGNGVLYYNIIGNPPNYFYKNLNTFLGVPKKFNTEKTKTGNQERITTADLYNESEGILFV